MPNHVTNVLTLHGESDQIRAMLEAIQYDDLGIGSVDFNKIIPMPESLNIEAGSQTSTGLKAYQDFIEVYTLGGTIHQDDLENIPRKSEDAFLRQRSDIRPKEWKLGKAAWNNIRLYGVPTWYECYAKLYITLVMISFIKCIVFHNYLLFFKNGKN